ncbi:MAG: sulfotransferase, partial [Caulobacterales bacterium]|nr:sulfotransferase [Caulobacterales bacterium]
MSGTGGDGPRPSLQHPLMGARLSVLAPALARNGGVSPRCAPLVLAMLASAVARAPFGALDRLERARLARSAPAPEAPLFIIGHWRSGTTHLHNLLGRAPGLGHISPIASGLPDEILTLGRWLRPWLERALPEDRHVDRVAVTATSPQEDEIPLASLQRLSVFHAVYFPRRFRALFDRAVFFDGASPGEIARWRRAAMGFAEKIALEQGARRIVIKNPVYTARVELLRRMWPEARFVHVRRNPYEVFVSTRHYYRTLLPELALQDYRGVDLDRFVLETFTRLMDLYERQRRAVPEGALAEVSYERLRRAPLEVLADVHARLGLDGWAATRPRVEAYLRTI